MTSYIGWVLALMGLKRERRPEAAFLHNDGSSAYFAWSTIQCTAAFT